MEENISTNGNNTRFIKRVLIASAIVSLFVVVLLILKSGFNVLLLILAGVLMAVYFRGLSYYISGKWKLHEGLSLTIVIVGTVIIFILLGLLLGTKIQSQMSQLGKEMPSSVQEFKDKISQYEWGRQILKNSKGMQKKLGTNQKVLKTVRGLFKTTFGILGDIYVIIFIGIFFTANPALYKNSIVVLVPDSRRKRADEVIVKIGYTLRSWLIGKIFAMIVVTILSGIGLLVLGVPMALALALAIIAGLLNFIPNFGPILGMIPAVLVALSQGTTTALIVAALFTAIQVAESNFITPLVQQKLIEIPPAYIIITQVLMGLLTGALGLILATPFIAIVMVLIQELYIKKIEEPNF